MHPDHISWQDGCFNYDFPYLIDIDSRFIAYTKQLFEKWSRVDKHYVT
jgi:hypothetical protein